MFLEGRRGDRAEFRKEGSLWEAPGRHLEPGFISLLVFIFDIWEELS